LANDLPEVTVEMVKYELENATIPVCMTFERDCRDELLRRLRQMPNPMERPLLASFGHGDLSMNNVIANEANRLFFVDWEMSGQMPIVWDFRKLFTSVPSVIPRIVCAIRTEIGRLGWRDAMDAEQQCLLGLCGRYAERSRMIYDEGFSSSSPEQKKLKDLRRIGRCLQSGALG
jgi:hypothetical protein